MTYPVSLKEKGSDLTICFSSERAGHVVIPFGRFGTGEYKNDWTSALCPKWEPYIPPKETETVYEWMYKNSHGSWDILPTLLTEEQIKIELITFKYKKTGREFQVEKN